MTSSIKPIPDNCPSLMPYLIVRRAAEALEFYKRVFAAVEVMRLNAPDGSIGHAEIKIGDAVIMLSEENPAWRSQSPETLGGSPVTLFMYVTDVDATFTTAIQAGAKALMPVKNQFWGDRTGIIADPFGHRWHIGSHIEDVDPADMQRRMSETCFPDKLRDEP